MEPGLQNPQDHAGPRKKKVTLQKIFKTKIEKK